MYLVSTTNTKGYRVKNQTKQCPNCKKITSNIELVGFCSQKCVTDYYPRCGNCSEKLCKRTDECVNDCQNGFEVEITYSWNLKAPYWSRANAIEALLGWMYRARIQEKKIDFAKRAEQEIIKLTSDLGFGVKNYMIEYNITAKEAEMFRSLSGSHVLIHQEDN